MKITSKDIADKLGISQSTVSLALRNDPRIKDETRKRVTEMADELGYTPSQVSRDLISGKTKTVAVLVAFQIFEHVGKMIGGMADAANEQNYSIKLLILDGKKDVSEFARECLGHRVAGVIAIGLRPSSSRQVHEIFSRHDMPVTMLVSNEPNLACTHVRTDDESGAQQAAEHLIGLGHRRLAMLTGHMDSISTKRMIRAFWGEAGRLLDDPDLPRPTALGYHINDVAVHKTRELLQAQPRPTALFCTTDFMAAVAIREARRMGLRVPEDLSVVGFGNLVISEITDPPMTTIDQTFTALGQTAMNHMLRYVKSNTTGALHLHHEIILPTELIVRDSTCPPSSAY